MHAIPHTAYARRSVVKRISALILTIVICFSCLAGAQAASLTKKEQYASAQEELARYLNDEQSVPLELLLNTFSSLGSYEFSTAFSIYTEVLLNVENGSFDNIQLRLGLLRRNTRFCEYLSEAGYGTMDEFENYVRGRESEAAGSIGDAIAFYGNSISFMDSMDRLLVLEQDYLEARYQEACALMLPDTAEGNWQAYAILTELAAVDYKDSALLMAELLARPTATPTVAPTAVPTATPTVAPTAVPTAAPTAIPTAAPVSTPVITAPPAPAWPEIAFQAHSVKLTGSGERVSARLAPDKQAASVGGYRIKKAARYTALFREGNYIYCDAVYAGVDRRCVYFSAGYVSGGGNVQEIVFEKTAATMATTASPRLGPSEEYQLYSQVVLTSGTSIQVCGQYGEWLFIEYPYSFRENKTLYEGTGRGWVSAEAVAP